MGLTDMCGLGLTDASSMGLLGWGCLVGHVDQGKSSDRPQFDNWVVVLTLDFGVRVRP